MSKEDFFNELSESLEGEVSRKEYNESLSYYRDYFREQEALGRTEQDILDELGSGRLIAHSIIDAHGLDSPASHRKEYYEEPAYDAGSTYDAGSADDDYYEDYVRDNDTGEVVNDPQPGPVGQFFNSVGRIITVIAVLLLAGLFLRAFLPVFLILIAVVVLMSLFR